MGLKECGRSNEAVFFRDDSLLRRTEVPIGRRCGVVFANNQEDAFEKAWTKYGNDTSCKLWVDEIPEDGYAFTVYKSEI